MEHPRILIVDDEQDIREILQFNLENSGFIVDTAASAEKALEILSPQHNLIILDIMMGGISGLKMAEIVRKERHNQIPIIFLTAKSSENDLLTGFSAGGDDYISKPFSIHEVIARAKAIIKRTSERQSQTAEQCINAGNIRIDLTQKIVYINDSPVVLSKKEFEILYLLASHPKRVYSREDIINELWKDAPYILDRTVDVHIARIRSKLGEYKKYLTNRTGYGYCFNVDYHEKDNI